MNLERALLAVLMFFPDQLARRMAQDEMDRIKNEGRADKKMLKRIVALLKINPDRAQHADVWRARPVIEAEIVRK